MSGAVRQLPGRSSRVFDAVFQEPYSDHESGCATGQEGDAKPDHSPDKLSNCQVNEWSDMHRVVDNDECCYRHQRQDDEGDHSRLPLS